MNDVFLRQISMGRFLRTNRQNIISISCRYGLTQYNADGANITDLIPSPPSTAVSPIGRFQRHSRCGAELSRDDFSSSSSSPARRDHHYELLLLFWYSGTRAVSHSPPLRAPPSPERFISVFTRNITGTVPIGRRSEVNNPKAERKEPFKSALAAGTGTVYEREKVRFNNNRIQFFFNFPILYI